MCKYEFQLGALITHFFLIKMSFWGAKCMLLIHKSVEFNYIVKYYFGSLDSIAAPYASTFVDKHTGKEHKTAMLTSLLKSSSPLLCL